MRSGLRKEGMVTKRAMILRHHFFPSIDRGISYQSGPVEIRRVGVDPIDAGMKCAVKEVRLVCFSNADRNFFPVFALLAFNQQMHRCEISTLIKPVSLEKTI